MMKAKAEYKKYMKQKILSTAKVIFCQIFILILFISLWQVLSDKGIINSFLCSSPKKVVTTIINLYKSNDLFVHVWVTLKEILISFGLGSLIGIVFAAFLWYSPFSLRY